MTHNDWKTVGILLGFLLLTVIVALAKNRREDKGKHGTRRD